MIADITFSPRLRPLRVRGAIEFIAVPRDVEDCTAALEEIIACPSKR